MKPILVTLVTVLLAGCAILAGQEHARRMNLALRDDQTCQARGWQYPQPRYVSCRMDLEDTRLYRDWMSLQLMHQSQYQPPYGPPPVYPYREAFRPLDRAHYHCRYVSENGKDYILCGEQARKN